MLPIETTIPFIIASMLLAIAPGPDNIFVLSQSTLYGKRSSILITLGLCTRLIFHTSLVALGVATLLQTSSWAFVVLKTLGASYLLYLAWQIFKRPLTTLDGDNTALSDKALYLRGIFMNISNPKAYLSFISASVVSEKTSIKARGEWFNHSKQATSNADRRAPTWRAGIPSIHGHKWRFFRHNPKGWDYFCGQLRCMKYIPVFHRFAASKAVQMDSRPICQSLM
ncbi:MAG: LysE family translocator [Methylophaga sp.]|nr:LysE family translocator [Methylophaga sp.]